MSNSHADILLGSASSKFYTCMKFLASNDVMYSEIRYIEVRSVWRKRL
jgi:hypothetical protein